MAEKRQKSSVTDSVRVGLFGASGSGKTYKAKQLCKNCNRLIVFDNLGEYEGLNFKNMDLLMKTVAVNWQKGFKLRFIPPYGAEIKALDELCKHILALQAPYNAGTSKAKITLVVDELDLSFPSGIRRTQPRHAFGFMCNRGRHYGVNLIGISQRPSQVDISFRANLSAAYYFRLAEPADIDTALKNLGNEWRSALVELKNRQYLYKADGKVKNN